MKTLHHQFHCLLVILLAGCLGAGCAGGPKDDSTPVAPSSNQTKLRIGDQITIRVDTGSAQAISQDSIIDENGEISLPLINHVKAATLTPSQLEEKIVASYSPRFFVRVSATVLATLRFFYMGGEVRSPGRFNWTEDITILKAVNMAGGFTDFANKGKVQISRGGKNLTFNADDLRQHPERDVTIQPGDSLYVPRSIF